MTENHMVRCSAKDGDRVTGIGGTNSDGSAWRMSERDAVAGIQSGKLRFYVNSDTGGIWLLVEQKQGREVLSVTGDPSLLLRLPDCP